MKLRIENDFKELGRKQKIAVFVVLGLVVLVMISWAADGFSSLDNDVLQKTHGDTTEIDHHREYNAGVSESWN